MNSLAVDPTLARRRLMPPGPPREASVSALTAQLQTTAHAGPKSTAFIQLLQHIQRDSQRGSAVCLVDSALTQLSGTSPVLQCLPVLALSGLPEGRLEGLLTEAQRLRVPECVREEGYEGKKESGKAPATWQNALVYHLLALQPELLTDQPVARAAFVTKLLADIDVCQRDGLAGGRQLGALDALEALVRAQKVRGIVADTVVEKIDGFISVLDQQPECALRMAREAPHLIGRLVAILTSFAATSRTSDASAFLAPYADQQAPRQSSRDNEHEAAAAMRALTKLFSASVRRLAAAGVRFKQLVGRDGGEDGEEVRWWATAGAMAMEAATAMAETNTCLAFALVGLLVAWLQVLLVHMPAVRSADLYSPYAAFYASIAIPALKSLDALLRLSFLECSLSAHTDSPPSVHEWLKGLTSSPSPPMFIDLPLWTFWRHRHLFSAGPVATAHFYRFIARAISSACLSESSCSSTASRETPLNAPALDVSRPLTFLDDMCDGVTLPTVKMHVCGEGKGGETKRRKLHNGVVEGGLGSVCSGLEGMVGDLVGWLDAQEGQDAEEGEIGDTDGKEDLTAEQLDERIAALELGSEVFNTLGRQWSHVGAYLSSATTDHYYTRLESARVNLLTNVLQSHDTEETLSLIQRWFLTPVRRARQHAAGCPFSALSAVKLLEAISRAEKADEGARYRLIVTLLTALGVARGDREGKTVTVTVAVGDHHVQATPPSLLIKKTSSLPQKIRVPMQPPLLALQLRVAMGVSQRKARRDMGRGAIEVAIKADNHWEAYRCAVVCATAGAFNESANAFLHLADRVTPLWASLWLTALADITSAFAHGPLWDAVSSPAERACVSSLGRALRSLEAMQSMQTRHAFPDALGSIDMEFQLTYLQAVMELMRAFAHVRTELSAAPLPSSSSRRPSSKPLLSLVRRPTGWGAQMPPSFSAHTHGGATGDGHGSDVGRGRRKTTLKQLQLQIARLQGLREWGHQHSPLTRAALTHWIRLALSAHCLLRTHRRSRECSYATSVRLQEWWTHKHTMQQVSLHEASDWCGVFQRLLSLPHHLPPRFFCLAPPIRLAARITTVSSADRQRARDLLPVLHLRATMERTPTTVAAGLTKAMPTDGLPGHASRRAKEQPGWTHGPSSHPVVGGAAPRSMAEAQVATYGHWCSSTFDVWAMAKSRRSGGATSPSLRHVATLKVPVCRASLSAAQCDARRVLPVQAKQLLEEDLYVEACGWDERGVRLGPPVVLQLEVKL
ncbi:unnamed protein product [Vitrella brassicaformis CCMP3155]|uniref:Uncharacterized protein n=1 Tax=Vitrella brassicaformis (strain CCMP3155) TaxID=1169540 RepID=A0A0G4ES19_VITBC|nr:unnamed protein product [Vitrella brassicaformis CCMP3155]|eukprot:CEM00655.1 unnamed protein product [Vitrella brassicaformis CCMP3155]